LTTGNTDNSSLNTILYTMRFMPNIKTLIWGDGIYTEPSTGGYYMNTDLGFMRGILYFGIFGVILIYTMVLAAIRKIGKKSYFTGFMILITFITFEYKGEIWYSLFPLLLIVILLNDYGTSKQCFYGDNFVIPMSQMICQQDEIISIRTANHLANKYAHEYKLRLKGR